MNGMEQLTPSEEKQIRTEFNKKKKGIGLSGYSVGEYLTEGKTAKIYTVRSSFSLKQYVLRVSEEIPAGTGESYNQRELHILNDLMRSHQAHIVDYVGSFVAKVTGPYRVRTLYCAVMEYLIPLRKLRSVGDNREIAVRLGNDLLPLLQTLWDKSIIHRDIKPENIFYDKDFRNRKGFMLGDFGIARSDSETDMTNAGTDSTKAPEIEGLDRELDGSMKYSDMYSLGMVMYYYLNECVFPSNRARLTNPPDKQPFPLPRYGTRRLKELVVKATQYYPRDRFASPQEMLRELQQCEEYHQFMEQDQSDSDVTYVPDAATVQRMARLHAEMDALRKQAAQREQELTAATEALRRQAQQREKELLTENDALRRQAQQQEKELTAEAEHWKARYTQKEREWEELKARLDDREKRDKERRETPPAPRPCEREGGTFPQPSPPVAVPAEDGSVEAGRLVPLGQYPQGERGTVHPIMWRVLTVEGDRALLITEKLIDCKRYSEAMMPVTWETCSLRKWLNNVFFTEAFDSGTQSRILWMNHANPGNEERGVDGGSVTRDRVFLLSAEEAAQYFANNDDRKAAVTHYARKQGSRVNDKFSLPDGGRPGWWWLRSPGRSETSAAHVNIHGNISTTGTEVNQSNGSIRPAVWLKL